MSARGVWLEKIKGFKSLEDMLGIVIRKTKSGCGINSNQLIGGT